MVPLSRILRFASVSDLDEYRELLHDSTYTLAHLQLAAEPELHEGSEEAFELVE